MELWVTAKSVSVEPHYEDETRVRLNLDEDSARDLKQRLDSLLIRTIVDNGFDDGKPEEAS